MDIVRDLIAGNAFRGEIVQSMPAIGPPNSHPVFPCFEYRAQVDKNYVVFLHDQIRRIVVVGKQCVFSRTHDSLMPVLPDSIHALRQSEDLVVSTKFAASWIDLGPGFDLVKQGLCFVLGSREGRRFCYGR
jgi:hypothetical protein